MPTNVIATITVAATMDDMADGNIGATKTVVIRMRVGQRPLHGTKLLVRMAISRSRGELMLLQEMTPVALQPKPIHIVMACFPCAPDHLKNRSILNATLAR